MTLTWPLTEVAFIGHSNVGKSALVNLMSGHCDPDTGIAHVSNRAGWTDSVNFYQVVLRSDGEVVPGQPANGAKVFTRRGEEHLNTKARGVDPALYKARPSFVLVDMPGYGPSVTDDHTKKRWHNATMRYLRRRPASILKMVFVLVDATRGLCKEDSELLKALDECRPPRPYHIVLTKCDTLRPKELAQCNWLVSDTVARDHTAFTPCPFTGGVSMISSKHFQGIEHFFGELLLPRALAHSPPPPPLHATDV
jgi:GTP-binding protein EngB required for normal cell division